MRFGATLRDRVIASDPGHVRLFMALRATASVGTALGLLEILARRYGLPLTVPLLGAALGMTWSIAVNDPDPRSQRQTTLLLWIPAAAAITIGTYVATNRILSDAVFIALLFVSFYLRKYGPRWVSVGFLFVLGFFFALFLRATFAELPWLLAALAVTDACTYFFRFILLRDRPEHALSNGLAALRARVRLIARTVAQAAERGRWNGPLRLRAEHHLFRLNELGLSLDDLIHDSNADDMRAAILETEIAVQSLVENAIRNPCAPQLRTLLHEVSATVGRLSAMGARVVVTNHEWTPRTGFRVGAQPEAVKIPASTRQAIQVTAASAAAIVVGELLSPQRWYWAVLAAFIVFSGTSSVGETLLKAWSRVAGTALGIAAGVALMKVVHGREIPEFAVLFICLFAAVYLFRLSYGLMIFFITAVLSMLYGLLGLFSDQLLVLRLIETAAGAGIGGIAATLILPLGTDRVVNSVVAEALQRLGDAVGASIDRLTGERDVDTMQSMRAFDESLQSVRAQLRPLINATRFGANQALRARLAAFAAAAHYARLLSVLAHQRPAIDDPALLKTERAALDATIAHLLVTVRDGTPFDAVPLPPQQPARESAAATLRSINRALTRTAQTYR